MLLQLNGCSAGDTAHNLHGYGSVCPLSLTYRSQLCLIVQRDCGPLVTYTGYEHHHQDYQDDEQEDTNHNAHNGLRCQPDCSR